MRKLVFVVFATLFFNALRAQDVLPKITVKNINGKVIVSWLNDMVKSPRIINVQRSLDSLRNFVTIGSVINPENRENGFVDEHPLYPNLYYRIFLSFDGGSYMFSFSSRAIKFVPGFESLTVADSVALFHIRPSTTSSSRVYTGRDNNILLHLENAETKKYSVKFFDEDNRLVFTLNKLHEQELIVDKVNFVHSGWFFFEVYENGKMIERNKFFLPRDEKIMGTGEQGRKIRNKE